MLAQRHPLIWTFAGGCLSGAALIGLWPEGTGTSPREGAGARTAERYREPASADPLNDGATPAAVAEDEASAPNVHETTLQKPAALDAAPRTETGSSVADILLRLEAAYRQGLAAAPPQPTAAIPSAPPRELPAHEQTAAAAAAPAPPTNMLAAPPAALRERDARLASRDEAAPREIHIAGDLRQNTNVGTVNEGPVVVVQEVVQYVPYLPLLPAAGFVPAYGPRPVTPRVGVPAVHFRSPAANTDGPFKYPVDLVH